MNIINKSCSLIAVWHSLKNTPNRERENGSFSKLRIAKIAPLALSLEDVISANRDTQK